LFFVKKEILLVCVIQSLFYLLFEFVLFLERECDLERERERYLFLNEKKKKRKEKLQSKMRKVTNMK